MRANQDQLNNDIIGSLHDSTLINLTKNKKTFEKLHLDRLQSLELVARIK